MTQTPICETVWRPLLDAALERFGGNCQAVADELGVSRTTVSLVKNRKYPSPLHAFGKRVMDKFDRYLCPAKGEEIARSQCHALCLRNAPTSSPREMRIWRTCQTCAHNSTGD